MQVKKKIIIGTWPISGDYGHISNNDSCNIIEKCIENNFLHFDTAPNYGKGRIEKILGKYTLTNKYIKIDTKIGNSSNNIKSFKEIDLRSNFFSSLDRMKLEKVHTLYLHNPRLKDNEILNLINLLNKLKDSNLCNNIGISLANDFSYNMNILKNFDVVQADFNLLKPLDVSISKLTNLCARSIYASGILSKSKSLKIENFNKKYDHRSFWLNKQRIDYLNVQISIIKKIIDRPLKNFAFDYVTQKSNISKVIIGIKNLYNFHDLNTMVKNTNTKKIDSELNSRIINLFKKDEAFLNKELNY